MARDAFGAAARGAARDSDDARDDTDDQTVTDRELATTPDGSRASYTAVTTGRRFSSELLDALEPARRYTGARLRAPFVSPDGSGSGSSTLKNTLKKIAITAGPAGRSPPLDGASRGAVAGVPDDRSWWRQR